MRKTGWVFDPQFLNHDTGPMHPERPDRLQAIESAVKEAGLLSDLTPIPFTAAEPETVAANHPGDYVARMENCCRAGEPFFMDPECPVVAASYEIARLAVGGTLAAVDAVMEGDAANAFCALRPPGHHAEPSRAMGFCYFNNVAIAARHLRARHGLKRIAILDWDVHHGNGTQASFYADAGVYFCSLHQDPRTLYPGTGYASERGAGPGKGTTLNIPLPPGSSDEDYKDALHRHVEPLLSVFQPQFLLLSAGFDGHADDPLSHVQLTDDGYEWISAYCMDLADKHCDGRLVSVLEGGYDLGALGRCVVRHLRVLLDH